MSGEQADTAGTGQTGRNEHVEAADQPEPIDHAKFGAVIYGISALGYFVSLFLTMSLADEESFLYNLSGVQGVTLEDEEMFIAAMGGMDALITIAPVLAVGLGLYYYFDSETWEPTHKPAAIAAAAGMVVAAVALLVLLVIFEPEMADINIGDEVMGIIGATIGVAITAAATGFVLENYE